MKQRANYKKAMQHLNRADLHGFGMGSPKVPSISAHISLLGIIEDISQKIKYHWYGPWDFLNTAGKVPEAFQSDVVKAENFLENLECEQTKYTDILKTLNRLNPSLHVYVPEKTKLLLRSKRLLSRSGKNYTSYDFNVCSECNYHDSASAIIRTYPNKGNDLCKLVDFACVMPTQVTIESLITEALSISDATKKIYLPIRVFKADPNDSCIKAKESRLHANGLLVDLEEHTFSIHDPNGLTKKRGDFFERHFTNIAKQMSYTYKRNDNMT